MNGWLPRIWPNQWSDIDQRARKAQTRLRTFPPAIKSGLVEFHKAQCFFILTIATAALVAVRQGSLNEDTISLQGIFNNYSLIGTISIGGFLPVTFILLTLHSAEIQSWYLLTLSIFAVVLSAITMFSVGDFHLSPADLQKLTEATTSQYPNCGSRDPTTFCLHRGDDLTSFSASDFSNKASVGGPGLLFSTIILVLLIMDYCGFKKIWIYTTPANWLFGLLEKFSGFIQITTNGGIVSNLVPRSVHSAQTALHEIQNNIYLIIWGCYFLLILYFMNDLRSPSNGATVDIVKTWTFAQIVAITVWAGPLFEFLKLSVRKYWNRPFV